MTQQIFTTRKINPRKKVSAARRGFQSVHSSVDKDDRNKEIKKYRNRRDTKTFIHQTPVTRQQHNEDRQKQWQNKQTKYNRSTDQQINSSTIDNRNQPYKKYYPQTKYRHGPEDRLKIIPLGGCEEVGRNMTVFEYRDDIVIIDMGMQFPEEDQLGIDYIIPNIEYLKGKEKNIRGVIFTHGHLDHIGAVPLLIDKIGNPLIVASKMSAHLIRDRVEDKEKGSAKKLRIKTIASFRQIIKLGNFRVRFFPVAHSIIDATGIILETPVMNVIHPGDWNLPHGKTVGQKVDYGALDKKVKKPTVLMLESLGVSYNRPPVSEEVMYENLERIIAEAPGRIIIAAYSSMVERVKVLLEMAKKYQRKVAIDGYSMKKNMKISKEIGYINFNLRNLIDIKQINNYPDDKILCICTGAQGEDRAVLNRIANGEHHYLKFKKTDTVIFSSSIVPGNERSVQRLKDLIYRQSDYVYHSQIMDVHTGGHASAMEVKEVIKMINPTYFMPVYANHYMLKEAAKLARGLGYDSRRIFVPDNGSIIEFGRRSARILTKKVVVDPVFVDGLGVSDLQNVVLRDRQILSEDGMIVVIATVSRRTGRLVHNPDIISRGFVYLKENKELIGNVRRKVRKIVETQDMQTPVQDDYLRKKIRNDLGQFVFSKTGKRPMILPVVIEV